MPPKIVSSFRAPTAYEEEMLRAKRQQQLAEMLRQQAFMQDEEPFTFQGFRAMPSPAGALSRVLQAYAAKKVGEKAEQAETRAREADVAEFEALRRDLGPQTQVTGPDMFADPMGMASKYTPPVTQTVMLTPEEREERLVQAMATGGPRAQRYAELMLSRKPKEAEYGTTPQFDSEGRAFVVNKAGDVRYLHGVKAPAAAPAAVTPTTIVKDGRRVVIDARTGREIGAAPESSPLVVNYGSPVAGVDEQGNPVFFQPSRGGGQPAIVPGVRPEGKGPTESQSTARLYVERMAESEPVFESLTPPSYGSRAKEGLPGGVGNVLLTPESRQWFQAERNFINAVLRKESGAVISDAEFDNARKQYIPQPGDDPQTKEQKRRNRQTAIREIGGAAGPGYKPPAFGNSPIIDLPPRR